MVTLGVTETPFDSDDTLGNLTITSLPHDLSNFNGGKYTASNGTWTGTAAQFNALTFAAGQTAGTFTLSISAPNTTSGENATATENYTLTINSAQAAPAGIAGEAINLALSNPAVAAVTVMVAGLAAGWSLSEGTNNGDGTWTVHTSDLASLTVTTPSDFAGASVLNVSETWKNADGSTGSAYVADDVEAYSPGSPIFAWSGNDTLTGAGSNDEFVIAQPIGNDVIYNFNAASDKIDLVGFSNIAKFGDLRLANDANGDAVVTLGNGETITLHGTNAASLTPGNFLFNQTPVVENHGSMVIGDGALLPLTGTIDNTGKIALNASGDHTELQIIGDGVTLQGGGQLVLSDSAANDIVGTTSTTTLTNVDNTISGAGHIGVGDGNLTLINEAHGTIDANVAGGTLVVDTGHTVINAGLLEASNGGTLLIEDAVNGPGSGSAVINGGTLEFDSSSNVNVAFNHGTATAAYGELVLGNPENFCGQISGFSGTGPDTAHSDLIDLKGINYTSGHFSETYYASTGVLTVADGSHTVHLTFDGFDGTLNFASDGKGGTLITDPAGTDSGSANIENGLNGGNIQTVLLAGDDGKLPFVDVSGGHHANVPPLDMSALGGDHAKNSPLDTSAFGGNHANMATFSASTIATATFGVLGNDNFVFHSNLGGETAQNFNVHPSDLEHGNSQASPQAFALVAHDVAPEIMHDLGHLDIADPTKMAIDQFHQLVANAAHLH